MCAKHYERWKKYADPRVRRKIGNGEAAAFVTVAAQHEGDDCFLWPYSKGGAGYGRITAADGTRQVASRAVCIAVYGPPPTPTHEAAHSCGNGHLGCVTPKHLRWATRAENSADRDLHGTANKGERHGLHKLTEAQVTTIFLRAINGEIYSRIAADFKVTSGAIGSIRRRETWGWLTEGIVL